MNPELNNLQPYPFERLKNLFADASPVDQKMIALSIGEPKHAPPQMVIDKLQSSQSLVSQYPTTKGSPELRQAIASWLKKRFKLLDVDAEQQVLPVNGTREALFAIAQCISDRTQTDKNLILMPNPFYQIYEGAAYLAGLKPEFYNITKENQYRPDFDAIDDATWARCQMIYICTPGNPSGAVISEDELQKLINKAEEFDFTIVSDECYSEIYFDEATPPVGLLQAAHSLGNSQYKRCLVFHSLSKRSNLPGLRSGFIAGDQSIIEKFLLYRTYHGCAMSMPSQVASTLAWQDEQHVIENRRTYQQKFAAVLPILNQALPITHPDAAFYLWPELPISDETAALELYRQYGITVLAGSYLSREVNGFNPGKNHLRIALVAPLADCIEAAEKIKLYIESL